MDKSHTTFYEEEILLLARYVRLGWFFTFATVVLVLPMPSPLNLLGSLLAHVLLCYLIGKIGSLINCHLPYALLALIVCDYRLYLGADLLTLVLLSWIARKHFLAASLKPGLFGVRSATLKAWLDERF